MSASATHTEKVSARVNPELHRLITQIASEQQTSTATIVRQALVLYLKEWDRTAGS